LPLRLEIATLGGALTIEMQMVIITAPDNHILRCI